MGIWTAWVPIGNVIIFNMAHPIMDAFGWRAVWGFGTATALSALLLFNVFVSVPPQAEKRKNPGARDGPSFGRTLLKPTGWLLALAFAIFAFCLLGYNTWAPSYLSETMGIDSAAANSYTSLMFLAAIPANVIAGWMMNRTRHRNRLLTAAFAISAILFIFSFSLPSIGVAVVYVAALGFVTNFIPTSVFTLAPEAMPTLQLAGLGLAMANIGSGLGSLMGPPILGGVLGQGGWTAGSIMLPVVMGCGVIVSILAGRGLSKA
jgi:fucose permease